MSWVQDMDAEFARKQAIQNAPGDSWWQRQNRDWAAYPNYRTPADGPTDWFDFRKNFGGGFATEGDYQNWRENQQRTRSISDFVNTMSRQDPNSYEATSRGELAKYGGKLDDFLASQAPQFQAAQYAGPGANRFETGLSGAEQKLNALLTDPSSIQQTAAYKFRLGQGQEALQRQLGARGLLKSGNRLTELTKYGQDMASQEYDTQAQRLQNLLGTYSGAWNQAQGTNVQEALGRYGTAMQGALGSYGTAMQGHTARGNTLADLYKMASSSAAEGAKLSQGERLGWADVWTRQANKPLQYSTARAGGPSVKWG